MLHTGVSPRAWLPRWTQGSVLTTCDAEGREDFLVCRVQIVNPVQGLGEAGLDTLEHMARVTGTGGGEHGWPVTEGFSGVRLFGLHPSDPVDVFAQREY